MILIQQIWGTGPHFIRISCVSDLQYNYCGLYGHCKFVLVMKVFKTISFSFSNRFICLVKFHSNRLMFNTDSILNLLVNFQQQPGSCWKFTSKFRILSVLKLGWLLWYFFQRQWVMGTRMKIYYKFNEEFYMQTNNNAWTLCRQR